MVFVWNRSTRNGKLYLNGVYTGEQHYTGRDIDLILTNHTTYELGIKKDTSEILHGSLRDLMVFLRPLTTGEALTLCRGIGMKVLLAIIVNSGASAHKKRVSSPLFTRIHNTIHACIGMDWVYLWCSGT